MAATGVLRPGGRPCTARLGKACSLPYDAGLGRYTWADTRLEGAAFSRVIFCLPRRMGGCGLSA